LSDPAVAVPLVVVSASREPAEAVNALLRRQGIAARCTWVPAVKDLPDCIESVAPQLVLCVPGEQLKVEDAAAAVKVAGCAVPLVAIRDALTEEVMTADLIAGARDSISLAHPERAHRVLSRELDAARLKRACDEAKQAARKWREQLDTVLTRTNDAILVVQEGILVDANQAWLDLVGLPAAAIGEPVMDAFHEDSHLALKGALSACLKGQWKDHVLKVNARSGADGSGRVAMELLLTLGEHDGESCVRIMVPARKAMPVEPAEGPATAEPARLAGPAAPAATAAAPAQAPAASAPATPSEVPRLEPVAAARPAPPSSAPPTPATQIPTLSAPAAAAADVDPATRERDAVWVRHIQAALAENRFRLVQQPITSLSGGAPMFDLLIRMLDRSQREILPGEFLPAAERNNLMGAIDRWVMAAAARFAAQSKAGCLFVRLSPRSALDPALTRWLSAQVQSVNLDPKLLCLTITEAVAQQHQQVVGNQARAIKTLGLRFALERFGTGPDPLGLLDAVAMDFVKIDGRLVQGVAGDSLVQSKVEALVEAARERGVETIATNVEDANTMAVLWQLGVQYIAGFLIQKPEEIVMS
jgi:EAL domain-containing protein (putative c-di-GMP-specific phosphodiesterase class I)